MVEINDVKEMEDTISSPSDEQNTANQDTTVSEDVQNSESEVSDKRQIPYDRFQEVVKERNTYKELLESTKSTPTTRQIEDKAAEISEKTGESYDEALKIVKEIVSKETDKKFSELNRKIELDRVIQQNPDFYRYADPIKTLIKENPSLSWEQAYKLSKFEVSQMEARAKGVQEAKGNIAKKKSATVESASKAKAGVSQSVDEIDPMAKGPDGKFLYSLSELESVLPKSKNED